MNNELHGETLEEAQGIAERYRNRCIDLEHANASLCRQLLAHSDEVNRRGEKITELQSLLEKDKARLDWFNKNFVRMNHLVLDDDYDHDESELYDAANFKLSSSKSSDPSSDIRQAIDNAMQEQSEMFPNK